MWKSVGRAPSLRVLPWHLPYKWGKRHGKTSVRVRKTSVRLRKTSVRVQYTYILPKHPHITKPSQTHTLQNPQAHTHTHTHSYTHTHTHISQNNIKPPQYNLGKFPQIFVKLIRQKWSENQKLKKKLSRLQIYEDLLTQTAQNLKITLLWDNIPKWNALYKKQEMSTKYYSWRIVLIFVLAIN